MRILRLTLKYRFFCEILCGKKKTEYREVKPYWKSRLEGKTFDEIHFKNGYARNAPFMRVEFKGIRKGMFNGKSHYFIKLGRVLETKNVDK